MPCQPDTTRTFLEVVFTQALVGVVVVLVESVLPVWCALVGHVGADCRCCGIVSGEQLQEGRSRSPRVLSNSTEHSKHEHRDQAKKEAKGAVARSAQAADIGGAARLVCVGKALPRCTCV